MISVELKGRTGNHLFQYALCRVVAEKNGYDLCIPDNWLGKEFFDCSLGKKFKKQKNIFEESKVYNERRALVNRVKQKDKAYIGNVFTPKVFDVPDGTHLDGYWQSEKYFNGYEDKIRDWFHINEPRSKYIDEDHCIIHYRAQDEYLRSHTPKQEYFENAKEKIRGLKENIKFVVVTDNRELAERKFKDDKIISGDKVSDFKLIKSSKYKIISNSTFSWWAAWLGLKNSKMVIAPNRWMNYNFNMFQDDIFYPQDIRTEGFIYL